MRGFDLHPGPRVLAEWGLVERAGAFVAELAAEVYEEDGEVASVLLVTDPQVSAAGHVGRVVRSLRDAALRVEVFDIVRSDPTTGDVAACVAALYESKADVVVALGGGSVIDTAKAGALIESHGETVERWWGVDKALGGGLPIVAIPTTAGTGSELQRSALIADAASHRKMAVLAPSLMPSLVLLDAELTLSQPLEVSARTGLDAVAHAVESLVSQASTPASELYSREAFRLLSGSLRRVLDSPYEREAREAMLYGSAWAGRAVELSMLGAAHAAATPLSARFAMHHGLAVGAVLPSVVRFNGQDAGAQRRYAALARAHLMAPESATDREAHHALAHHLAGLADLCGARTALARLGPRIREELMELAEEAGAQWTARFNPVPVAVTDFQTLYLEALRG